LVVVTAATSTTDDSAKREVRVDFGTVLVVDDDPEARASIARLLTRAGFSPRELGGGEAALEAAREERPALAVVEVCLPDLSGYSVCRQLKDEYGDSLPVILVSARRTESFDRAAGFLVGADEYLAKPIPHDEFVIRARRYARQPNGAIAAKLTAREREVLGLLAEGLRHKEIAQRLYLSPKTVGTHVERIYKELEVGTRTQAIAAAMRDGFVRAP
jgi:DNA-binding NarL/FixJ family response regulator